jgi:hypothetical protein
MSDQQHKPVIPAAFLTFSSRRNASESLNTQTVAVFCLLRRTFASLAVTAEIARSAVRKQPTSEILGIA